MPKLILLVRAPEDYEDCSVIEYLVTEKQIETERHNLAEAKLSLPLLKLLRPGFPDGFILEGFYDEAQNNGEFIEQKISYLH